MLFPAEPRAQRAYLHNFVCYILLLFVSASGFASVQIPHIQTVLTKHIELAALGPKMRQFINCFLQSYMLLTFLFT